MANEKSLSSHLHSLYWLTATLLVLTSQLIRADEVLPIRIGSLYSSAGTMAISESSLQDSLKMLIDQQNKQGGILGRPIELVALNPKSDWLYYAEKARQLIEQESVAAIFGCWTSASRKAVLPVVEQFNSLLFYPVQYEGEEQSSNIFYLGAAPNQQAIPGVQFLKDSYNIERWILAGTDYVYPRSTNELLTQYLLKEGVASEDIMLSYTPFGHSDWQRVVGDIKQFSLSGKTTAIISTINGDANITFYKELLKQGVKPSETPVLAFSIGEQEIKSIGEQYLIGQLAVWNYFMSINSHENQTFIADLQAFSGDDELLVNDPIEAQYIGFKMWVEAVKKAGTTEVDSVREAIIGVSVANLSGGKSVMQENHHISKPVYVGSVQPNGQYRIIWKSANSVNGDPWNRVAGPNKDGDVN